MLFRQLLIIWPLIGASTLGIACNQASLPPTTPATVLEVTEEESPTTTNLVSPSAFDIRAATLAGSGSVTASQLSSGARQSGIWVTGTGKAVIAPDLANIMLGVESRQSTANAARQEAANAMVNVMEVLTNYGIETAEIKTQHYNIQPEYTWNEKARKSQITGYRVSNNLSVKTRDLDGLGALIDDVAKAAEDLVRVNGINFSAEHPQEYVTKARSAAVQMAMATAQQFADLTEVELGKLVYITDIGGNIPATRDYARAELAMSSMAGAPPTTSINPGELEVQVAVQAVFDIN